MTPALSLLSLSLALWGVGEGLFLIFQPFYLTQLGADPIRIGVILGFAGITMTLSHTPAGYLSDKIGTRPLLIASWLSGLLATAIMALGQTLTTFTIGLLLYSFTAFVMSPLGSYATAARGKLTVTRAVTFTTASFNFGTILGSTMGGWISENYSLRAIYIVACALFFVSTIIIFFLPAQPIHKHEPGVANTGSIFANRTFFTFLLASVFLVFFNYLSEPFTAKFLQEFRGVNFQQVGYLGSLAGIGRTTLMYFLGGLSPILGTAIAFICAAIFNLIIWKGDNLTAYFFAFFLSGGMRSGKVILVSMIRPFVRKSNIGLAYGIAETVFGSTTIFAPMLAGYLYDSSPELIFPVAIVGLVAASVIFFPIYARLKPITIEMD